MFLILGLTESHRRETKYNFLYIFVIGSNCPQLVYIGIATLTSVDLSIFSQSKNLVREILSFLSVWLCKLFLLLQHAHFSYVQFKRLYHFVLKHPILRFLISNRLFRIIHSTLIPFTLLDKDKK